MQTRNDEKSTESRSNSRSSRRPFRRLFGLAYLASAACFPNLIVGLTIANETTITDSSQPLLPDNRLGLAHATEGAAVLLEPPHAGANKQQDDREGEIEWKWDEAQTHLDYYVEHTNNMYSVERVPVTEATFFGGELVRIGDGVGVWAEFEAHRHTSFLIDRGIVIFAQFHPHASGCTILAIDLRTGDELWKTPLSGLGPIAHSKYSNRVILEVAGDQLLIFGNESGGRYIEGLAIPSGEPRFHQFVRN